MQDYDVVLKILLQKSLQRLTGTAVTRWLSTELPPVQNLRIDLLGETSDRELTQIEVQSTPEIPRPRYFPEQITQQGRTFGVVLDTSGSMDRHLLGEALGAIASYCESREVFSARVVFCDARPYDAGYLRPEEIAGQVTVRGRGGTVLQPGIDLLETTSDFPKDGPILIITDGFCDRFVTRREHAILLPEGRSLPFAPKGKVFLLSGAAK